VPFHLKGELNVVATADLHGLGADESKPATCEVSHIIPLKQALPWLLFAGLFWVQRSTCRSNLWILVALASSQLMVWGAANGLRFIPVQLVDVFGPVFQALAMGLAGTWLISTHLNHSTRWMAGLKMLVALAGIGLIAFAASADLADPDSNLAGFVTLLVCSTVTALALTGTAWICRTRCPWMKFLASFFLGCFLITFTVIYSMSGAAGAPSAFTISLSVAASIATALLLLLLPFLTISSRQAELSERFKALFHLPEFGKVASPNGNQHADTLAYRELS
jgi:hypothetical protein